MVRQGKPRIFNFSYLWHHSPTARKRMPPSRRLAAILFADITGYTAMMQRDEADSLRRLHRFRSVLEERVASHGGQVLQHIGDGSLVLFNSAVEAVASAQEIQRLLQDAPKVPLRIGIHLGDIVMEHGQVYGDGVNLASRVETLGVPGSVLITERLMPDLSSHPEFDPVLLGHFEFKNVSEPMKVFAMRGQGLYVPRPDELSQAPVQLQQSRLRWQLLIGLMGVLLLGLGLAWAWSAFGGTADRSLPEKSIAVLPFEDLSPGGEQAYFADGIAEEVLNALSEVEGLKVAGRASAFAFRGRGSELERIREQLGVSSILTGSVRRQDNRLRITAELVSTEDGFQLWSARFDRSMDDIFAIQEEIAQAVASELRVLLSRDLKQGTDNQTAYEWYLRGRYELSQRSDGAKAAAAYFQQALDIDSDFADAYAGLGNAYLWLGWNNYLPSNEAFPKAKRYAEQALERDSSLAYAHALLGGVSLWYEWDWARAERHLQQALSRNPSEGAAHLDMGWLQVIQGRFAQGIRHAERAVATDPLNLEYNIDLADFYRMAGDYESANRAIAQIESLYPDNSELQWIKGLIAYTRGQADQAVRHFEEAHRLSGEQLWSGMHLAMALARSGEKESAEQLLEALEGAPELAESVPAELAPVYWELDREAEALDWLERAYAQRATWLISLRADPVWAGMREHPRVQALIENMGL